MDNLEHELMTIARELDKNGSIILLKRFYYKNGKKQAHKGFRLQEVVMIDTFHRHYLEFIADIFPQEIKKVKDGFRLKYFSHKAIDFLEKVSPYLVKKKPQADLVLQFSKLKGSRGVRIDPEIAAQKMAIYKELLKEKERFKKEKLK